MDNLVYTPLLKNAHQVYLTSSQNHAWNEVYIDGQGWKIIDTSYDAQVSSSMYKNSRDYQKVNEY